MRKILLFTLLMLLSSTYMNATIYEDAEDLQTTRWKIDKQKTLTSITNLFDTKHKSNVIQLNGSYKTSSFILGSKKGKGMWRNTTEESIQWDMNIKGKYKIIIFAKTAKGVRYFYYNYSSKSRGLYRSKYIRIGLGKKTNRGKWVTITRNLIDDLQQYEPNNRLISVNGLKIYGAGKIDNVMLFNQNAPIAPQPQPKPKPKPKPQPINSKQKIFIIGDSTVYNASRKTEMGWGTAIKKNLLHASYLYNQARSGASSKDYKICDSLEKYCYKNHYWTNTKKLINNTNLANGGYLLIQFGHNDEKKNFQQKGTKPGRNNSFYNELKVFTDEAKVLGLKPVLITPIERMEKKAGRDTKKSHIKKSGDYAQTVRDLAKDEEILLLDLQDKSWNEFNKYRDSQKIMKKFAFDDVTHFSPKGAKIVAKWVKELACQADKELCAQFK